MYYFYNLIQITIKIEYVISKSGYLREAADLILIPFLIKFLVY